jgi:general L-amino acid transport system permease protein
MDLSSETRLRDAAGRHGGRVGVERAVRPAPRVLDWLRRNLFSSIGNTVLTVAVLAILGLSLPPLYHWVIADATISGSTRAACIGDGACWTFIKVRLPTFFYGHYPDAERWRVHLALALLVLFGFPVMRERMWRRGIFVLLLLTVFPVLAGILLVGGMMGLREVDTTLWGGLMLNVVISFLAVEASLLLGILLALGRRSVLSAVRTFSVGYIELWRGMPLLIIVITSATLVPLFLPEGASIDRLIRFIIAFSLFESAYMAEAIRGGLQGVPTGQIEAAQSIGLRWWQVRVLIELPQALRFAFPSIINTSMDLFKDTTLVQFIGLFDLLSAVVAASKDTAWLGYYKEGYVFAMALFFVCCFAMSLQARRLERRLNRHK